MLAEICARKIANFLAAFYITSKKNTSIVSIVRTVELRKIASNHLGEEVGCFLSGLGTVLALSGTAVTFLSLLFFLFRTI